MKRLYSFLSLFLVVAFGVSAQTYLTPSEYNALKLVGQLPGDPVIIGQPAPHGNFHPGAVQRDGPCACWIDPDSSYTLALAPNDDGSSSLISLPFTFNLFGAQYTTLYINNNGNVSFQNSYATYSAAGFPSPQYIMVAPFWADVDTRASADGTPGGTVTYKITPTALYVNWTDVGYFPQQTDLLNSFQLILTDGTDPAVPDGNVAYCYRDMQWTTGSASSGVGGFGGIPATVGANQGDGVNYSQIGRFDAPGTQFVGPDTINGVDWLDDRHFVFNTAGGSVPPVFSTTDGCDTLTVPESGLQLIQVEAFPGSPGEQVSITTDPGGLGGYTETTNLSGDFAKVLAEVNPQPGDAGLYTITYVASISGSNQTSQMHLYVKVEAATSIVELQEGSLAITPNPASDNVLVSWPAGMAPQRIDVIGIDGRTVRSVTPGSNSGQLQVDLQGLAAGTYVVRAVNNSGATFTRLIKRVD